MVSTDPCGQPLVVDEGGHRLAEAITRCVRHAKVLAHLTPAGTEVVRVAPRPGGRREDHRLLTEIRHAATSSQHSGGKSGQRKSPSAGGRLRLVYPHQPLARRSDDLSGAVSVAVASSKSTQRKPNSSEIRRPVAINRVMGSARSWR